MPATYKITRLRSWFTRYGCVAQLFNADGSPHVEYLPVAGQPGLRCPWDSGRTFWGSDGRKVRAEAVAWARSQIISLVTP